MSQPDLSESVPCGRPRRTRTARTTPTDPTRYDGRCIGSPSPVAAVRLDRRGRSGRVCDAVDEDGDSRCERASYPLRFAPGGCPPYAPPNFN